MKSKLFYNQESANCIEFITKIKSLKLPELELISLKTGSSLLTFSKEGRLYTDQLAFEKLVQAYPETLNYKSCLPIHCKPKSMTGILESIKDFFTNN